MKSFSLLIALIVLNGFCARAEEPNKRDPAFETARSEQSSPEAALVQLTHPSPTQRQQAITLLIGLKDPQTLPALIKATSDSDAGVRQSAVGALGQFDGPQVLPALIKAVDDPAPSVRATAVWALGELGDIQNLQALAKAMEDANPTVRQAAVEALGSFRDDRAATVGGEPRSRVVSLLKKALADPDPAVQIAARKALAAQGEIDTDAFKKRGAP